MRRRALALLRRPGLAVLAVLVWLLGVELGPGLHIARHGELGHHHHGAGEALACAGHDGGATAARGHHEHDGRDDDGDAGHHATKHHGHDDAGQHAVEHRERDTHHEHHAAEHHAVEHHAVEPHEHHAGEPHEQDAVGHLAHAPDSVPHGDGSLAHRDLVPLTPPWVLPPILSAPWRPVEVVQVVRISPRERTPAVLRARGPPPGAPTSAPLSLA